MEETTRLYVGNLPYVAQREDIEKLFADNDIPFQNIDISIDPFTGRNPSYCFVDIASVEGANHALEVLQSQKVRGRPVRINHKTEKRARGTRPDTKTYDRGWKPNAVPAKDASEDSYAFNRWESSKDAPSRWTAPSEEGRRLYVGGLPRISGQDAVNLEMRELFQGFTVEAVSKIISPHPSKAEEPGSHYYCFVDVASTAEADEAAKKLNGSPTPYGGQYKVSIARHRQPTKVHREQGLPWQNQEAEPPKRNLDGNWRRLDS